jgi:hypothetical protein
MNRKNLKIPALLLSLSSGSKTFFYSEIIGSHFLQNIDTNLPNTQCHTPKDSNYDSIVATFKYLLPFQMYLQDALTFALS